MTDEVKRLIESVETINGAEILIYDIADYVLKSDFDRVVEELTK